MRRWTRATMTATRRLRARRRQRPRAASATAVTRSQRRSAALRRKGFGRLLVDGRAAVSFDDVEVALLKDQSVLHVVVDRLRVAAGHADAADRFDRDGVQRRGRRGVRARAAGGPARPPAPSRRPSSTSSPSASSAEPAASPYEDPQPRLFSFNNPFGACPTCHGFGNVDRARHRPRRARSDAVDPGRRHRAVEQAALPVEPGRPEARGARRPASGWTCRGPI